MYADGENDHTPVGQFQIGKVRPYPCARYLKDCRILARLLGYAQHAVETGIPEVLQIDMIDVRRSRPLLRQEREPCIQWDGCQIPLYAIPEICEISGPGHCRSDPRDIVAHRRQSAIGLASEHNGHGTTKKAGHLHRMTGSGEPPVGQHDGVGLHRFHPLRTHLIGDACVPHGRAVPHHGDKKTRGFPDLALPVVGIGHHGYAHELLGRLRGRLPYRQHEDDCEQ